MSVSETLRHEAYALSESRARSDPETNWFEAKRALISRVAFDLSRARHPGIGSPNDDWCRAEESVSWSEWAEAALRPYLALECTGALGDVAAHFQNLEEIDSAQGVGVVAVLDGGPEFSRTKYAKHRWNGVDPGGVIEERDQTFYEFARYTADMFGGSRLEAHRAIEDRAYQDGCAIAFQVDGGCRGLAFALRLRRSLAEFNATHNRAWPDELHARIAIGKSWKSAVEMLSCTYADEIYLDRSVADGQPHCVMTLMLADGVRIGG